MISTEYLFTVEVRSPNAPTTIGTLGFEVAGMEVHSIEFLVEVDRADLPAQPDAEQMVQAQCRAAADRAAEGMALAAWPPGPYLLTVRYPRGSEGTSTFFTSMRGETARALNAPGSCDFYPRKAPA